MSKEIKDLIFISHAVPQDDYLAIWLASKLRSLGYNAWVDKEELRSGSAFWNDIEINMRDHSIKFLALVSESYISKSRNRNTGVFSEITLAKSLSRDIENYIIPIKVDNSSYDDFPINILPLDTIDFSENWGKGLKTLIKELEIQKVPKNLKQDKVLSLWHSFQEITGNVMKQQEFYGSNWFSSSLPENIYVYKFREKSKNIFEEINSTVLRNEDYYLGFFDDVSLYLKTEFKQKISIGKFLSTNSFELSNGDKILDVEPKFTYLMNKSINNYFYHHEGFRAYPLKKNKLIIYPRQTKSKSGFVSFRRNGKLGRRKLKGNKPVNWSFGLSFIFQLNPFPHFVANYHILSADENGFFDSDKQLEYRRSIPNEWYNRDWFERILAFMALATNNTESNFLSVKTGNETFDINLETVTFTSEYGYKET